jgi:hypothetical protein
MTQRMYSSGFMECSICSAKPGSPTLCPSCLRNRYRMESLQAELRLVTRGPVRSFRKRNLIYKGIQLTQYNYAEVLKFLDGYEHASNAVCDTIVMRMPFGNMKAHVGDWVVKSSDGDLYVLSQYDLDRVYQEIAE